MLPRIPKKFEEWAKSNNMDVEKTAKDIADGKAPKSNDKEQDVWADEVRSYVKSLAENAYGGTKDVVVYAVDFHI